MSEPLEKIKTGEFNRHGLCKIETATVVHAMGGSMLVAKVNELIDAVQDLRIRVSDDEVLVNGKRSRLISKEMRDE